MSLDFYSYLRGGLNFIDRNAWIFFSFPFNDSKVMLNDAVEPLKCLFVYGSFPNIS